jgi:hypothetical protein
MKQERVDTLQIAVRLPREMHDQLRQGDLGNVSEEIRRRIERTLQQDAIDPITRELVTGIVNLAADAQAFLGAAWHSSQAVQEVFAAAVALRVAAYKPSPSALTQLARDMGDAAASQVQQAPDALGAVIERADRRTHSYEHLQRLQTKTSPPPRTPLSGMRKPKGE